MATLLTMPKLGMTMDEGTVHAWFKQEGDAVREGEPLLSVLTDKIDIEVDAPVSGIVRKIFVGEGETVPINTPIAIIADADADIADLLAQAGEGGVAADGHGGPPTSAAHVGGDSEAPVASGASSRSSPPGLATTVPVSSVWIGVPEAGAEEVRVTSLDDRRVRATPVARRMAREHGIDLALVPGSGPRGRVTRADVEEYVASMVAGTCVPVGSAQAAGVGPASGVEAVSPPSPAGVASGATGSAYAEAPSSLSPDRIPLSGMRRVIAQRMSESAFTAPHVTLMTEADVTELVKLRQTLNEEDRDRGGSGISYVDLFIVIAARALLQHPYMNARIEGNDIVVERAVHMGIAVAVPDGLLVPVMRDVGELGVGAVARRRAAVVEAARTGTLSPDALSGGTFTITNLGAYDIDGFTPIINPPQAAILGMGRIVEKPAVFEGQICVRSMMTLSLSFDHRLVDGAPAAAFLQTVKRLAEQPALLHL